MIRLNPISALEQGPVVDIWLRNGRRIADSVRVDPGEPYALSILTIKGGCEVAVPMPKPWIDEIAGWLPVNEDVKMIGGSYYLVQRETDNGA